MRLTLAIKGLERALDGEEPVQIISALQYDVVVLGATDNAGVPNTTVIRFRRGEVVHWREKQYRYYYQKG